MARPLLLLVLLRHCVLVFGVGDYTAHLRRTMQAYPDTGSLQEKTEGIRRTLVPAQRRANKSDDASRMNMSSFRDGSDGVSFTNISSIRDGIDGVATTNISSIRDVLNGTSSTNMSSHREGRLTTKKSGSDKVGTVRTKGLRSSKPGEIVQGNRSSVSSRNTFKVDIHGRGAGGPKPAPAIPPNAGMSPGCVVVGGDLYCPQGMPGGAPPYPSLPITGDYHPYAGMPPTGVGMPRPPMRPPLPVTQPPIIYVDEPTAAATPVPTYPGPPAEPTVLPTPAPSKVPTFQPTPAPTTPAPTDPLTGKPQPPPSALPPTPLPTAPPTDPVTKLPEPTLAPTSEPTRAPTGAPTTARNASTPTPEPSPEPTPRPFGPTVEPTPEPTPEGEDEGPESAKKVFRDLGIPQPTPEPTPEPTDRAGNKGSSVASGTGGSGVTVQERTYTVALTLRIPLVNLTSTARNEICESAQTAYNCGGGIQCNCTLGEDASGLSFIHAFIRHSSHLRQDSSRSGSSGTYTFIVVVVAVAPAETFGANPVPDQDTVLKSFKSFAKDPALKIVMKSASVVLRKAKLRVMSNGNGSCKGGPCTVVVPLPVPKPVPTNEDCGSTHSCRELAYKLAKKNEELARMLASQLAPDGGGGNTTLPGDSTLKDLLSSGPSSSAPSDGNTSSAVDSAGEGSDASEWRAASSAPALRKSLVNLRAQQKVVAILSNSTDKFLKVGQKKPTVSAGSGSPLLERDSPYERFVVMVVADRKVALWNEYWSSFLVASPEGVVGLGDWKTVPGVKGLPGLVPENKTGPDCCATNRKITPCPKSCNMTCLAKEIPKWGDGGLVFDYSVFTVQETVYDKSSIELWNEHNGKRRYLAVRAADSGSTVYLANASSAETALMIHDVGECQCDSTDSGRCSCLQPIPTTPLSAQEDAPCKCYDGEPCENVQDKNLKTNPESPCTMCWREGVESSSGAWLAMTRCGNPIVGRSPIPESSPDVTDGRAECRRECEHQDKFTCNFLTVLVQPDGKIQCEFYEKCDVEANSCVDNDPNSKVTCATWSKRGIGNNAKSCPVPLGQWDHSMD